MNKVLSGQGWIVLRFWGKEIQKETEKCCDIIEKALEGIMIFKTIDLCAGIGGIRRGFERTGYFQNVLSAEIDESACKTYEHLFGENPRKDLTSETFKEEIQSVEYDVLLAGFPCQAFSSVGLQMGFEDKIRGTIFFDIAKIIKATHPKAVFLENVGNLYSHNKGQTFKTIIETLENHLSLL